MYWINNAAYLSVEDGDLFVRGEDVDYLYTSNSTRHHHHDTRMKISLLDIARPAKQKGIAKDFEVVQKVRNVVVLEDDLENPLGYRWEDDEWDEWEQIYYTTEKKSYSSALKGT